MKGHSKTCQITIKCRDCLADQGRRIDAKIVLEWRKKGKKTLKGGFNVIDDVFIRGRKVREKLTGRSSKEKTIQNEKAI